MSYDIDAMRSGFDGLYPRLTDEHRTIYNKIMNVVDRAEVVCSFYTATSVQERLLFGGRCVPTCVLEEIWRFRHHKVAL